MASQTSLIADLEDAVQNGSSERRIETLRRITNLYLNDSDRLNEDQIARRWTAQRVLRFRRTEHSLKKQPA